MEKMFPILFSNLPTNLGAAEVEHDI